MDPHLVQQLEADQAWLAEHVESNTVYVEHLTGMVRTLIGAVLNVAGIQDADAQALKAVQAEMEKAKTAPPTPAPAASKAETKDEPEKPPAAQPKRGDRG